MKTRAPLKKRRQSPEQKLCIQFYQQFKQLQMWKQIPRDILCFHIANEQGRNTGIYVNQLKLMGLLPGVADYCIVYPGGYCAFIEFKVTQSGCKLKDNQLVFQNLCFSLEVPHLVTCSIQDAIRFIHSQYKSI